MAASCCVCHGEGCLLREVCPFCEGDPALFSSEDDVDQRASSSAGKASASGSIPEPLPLVGSCSDAKQIDILDEFVRNGFVKLHLPEDEVPAHVHQTIYDEAIQACKARDISNNIFPDIIDLEQVLTSKTLVDALQTVLGPGCRLHRHRYLHESGDDDQAFHKDSFYGWRRPRSHRPRWAMVLYYPQKTTVDMGPTAVLSGSQYLALDHEARPTVGEDLHPEYGMVVRGSSHERDEQLQQIKMSIDASLEKTETFMEVEAGSVCLMHYDLWHRASRRRAPVSELAPQRFMIKFQYYRVNDPCPLQVSEPSQQPTISSTGPTKCLGVAHEDVMMWLRCKSHCSDPTLTIEQMQLLIVEMQSESEAFRIFAAYSLGRVARTASAELQQEALACLADAMTHFSERSRRAAAFGFVAAGAVAEHTLLTVLRSQACARKYVFWSLGEIDTVSSEASRALLDASDGTDGYVYDDDCTEMLACAAATAGLGLMAQRAHRASDQELFSIICRKLIVCATPWTAGPHEDLCREEATLSLLLACEAGPSLAAAQPGLVRFLQRLASDRPFNGHATETDRYVMGFAAEALISLAEADCAEAREALESVLKVGPDADVRRLVRQRRCSRSTPYSPF